LAAFVTANPIPFASGSASLLPESDSILTQIAGLLNQVPATKAVIEGHTDSQGNEAVNAELSSARAESVRAALVAKGVAADRLTAVGFGESQPIADNATTEGRAANRRVVFNLTKG
jgi:outer membrane protein OmpA-like peptidoglycan-associated protein